MGSHHLGACSGEFLCCVSFLWVSGHHPCGGRMWQFVGSQVHSPTTPLSGSVWPLAPCAVARRPWPWLCYCYQASAIGGGAGFLGSNAASSPTLVFSVGIPLQLSYCLLVNWGQGVSHSLQEPCLWVPSQCFLLSCLLYMSQYICSQMY